MERMISNHKIQTALDEIKEISKIDLALYSEKGKQVAATFEPEGDMEEAVTSFATSMAESQMLSGCHFFKVMVEGEVEYILYGDSDAKNIASAYGTIFAIRYVLNLPADFSKHWNNAALIKTAAEIQAASYGMIPAPLTKLVIILGLTAAESAKDLMYLQKGVPLKLVKTKNDIEITYPQGKFRFPRQLSQNRTFQFEFRPYD